MSDSFDKIVEIPTDKKEYITYPNMFWDFDGYGKICLN